MTLAIVAIDGWNRLAIGFRAVTAEHQVDRHTRSEESGALWRPSPARPVIIS
ncbi:MAG: hypothetical protein ACLQU1_43485 [Bryobacteraceae bacterium]